MEVSGSTDTCSQLVKELEEHIQVDEGKKEFNSFSDRAHSDRAHLKSLKSSLFNIVGSNLEECKKILFDLMTTYAAHVYLPSVRRNYVHLCLETSPSSTELNTCLEVLEKNFEVVGHVDRDMINWISIKRNMPDVGNDTEKIEKTLLSWKNHGPCIITDKRKIETTNNPVWVNFYLTLCYFIKLIETGNENVSRVVKQFHNVCSEMRRERNDNMSRSKIREWLQCDSAGFGRLKPGHPIQGDMMQLTGTIGNPSFQEAQQTRSDKFVCWKNVYIPLDTRKFLTCSFNQGQQVTFGVGFTFRGPLAIPVDTSSESASSKPNSPSKVASEDEEQQTFEVLSSALKTRSYSQATKSSNL